MQDGSLVKRRDSQQALSERFLPWSRTQLSEAGKDAAVLMNRGQVHAQTFVARRWSAKGGASSGKPARTGRANESVRAQSQSRGASCEMERARRHAVN